MLSINSKNDAIAIINEVRYNATEKLDKKYFVSKSSKN